MLGRTVSRRAREGKALGLIAERGREEEQDGQTAVRTDLGRVSPARDGERDRVICEVCWSPTERSILQSESRSGACSSGAPVCHLLPGFLFLQV